MKYFSIKYWFKMWVLSAVFFEQQNKNAFGFFLKENISNNSLTTITLLSIDNQESVLTKPINEILKIKSPTFNRIVKRQVSSVKNNMGKVSMITFKKIRLFTVSEIKLFTKEQLQAFTPIQISYFTAEQISAFTEEQVKFFTEKQIEAFTPEQFKTLHQHLLNNKQSLDFNAAKINDYHLQNQTGIFELNQQKQVTL